MKDKTKDKSFDFKLYMQMVEDKELGAVVGYLLTRCVNEKCDIEKIHLHAKEDVRWLWKHGKIDDNELQLMRTMIDGVVMV